MTATDSDTSRPKRRRWYVLHLDTYLVLLLVLVPWTMIVVPGGVVSAGGTTGLITGEFEHGWPCVHMRRLHVTYWDDPTSASTAQLAKFEDLLLVSKRKEMEEHWLDWTGYPKYQYFFTRDENHLSFFSESEPIWISGDNWKQRGKIVIVFKTALVLNFLTAIILCVAVVGPYEWWRRRHGTFSLRSLMIGVFLVAVALKWWSVSEASSNHDKEMIATLQKDGFSGTVDCKAPVWLQKLVGLNYLPLKHRVSDVYGPGIHDEIDRWYIQQAVSETRGAPESLDLKHLEVQFVRRRLATLRTVFPQLKHLRTLSLGTVDDEMLASLKRFDAIRDLDIYDARFTDQGLTSISEISQLRELKIAGPFYDDRFSLFVDPNDDAKFIESIHIPKFTEQGLSHLRSLKDLRVLHLDGVAISDTGVLELGKLVGLEELTLVDVMLDEVTVKELRRLLPNTKIKHSNPDPDDWP